MKVNASRGEFLKNVSQIYDFLIKDFIGIHEDIIDWDIDIEFDVTSWLLKDVAPFGFVNMPLIYWELATCGSSCQSEAITWNWSGTIGAS